MHKNMETAKYEILINYKAKIHTFKNLMAFAKLVTKMLFCLLELM